MNNSICCSMLCGLLVGLAAVCFTPTRSLAQADPEPLLLAMTEESILFQEIPSVYGASKYEQRVNEAPSSVTIVTADEIEKYGYRTLADILRSVRSFYTAYDRAYDYVGVRGFQRPGDYNSRILLLVDGIRANDNVFDSAGIGTEFYLDVDLIDRVEIIRGPSSSIYGTSAFFGVVNVMTKRGRDLQGLEVSGEAGTHDTYRARLSYGNRFQNGLEAVFSGTYYESDGEDRLFFEEFNDPDTNNGFAEDSDEDEFESLFAKLSFRDFTFEGAYVDRDKDIPTAPWGIEFNDPRNRIGDESLYLDLKYEHTYNDGLGVLARVNYNKYYYDGDYAVDYSEDDDPYIVVNKDDVTGKWWRGELQLTKELFDTHKFIMGADYQKNTDQDQKNFDVDGVYLDDKRDSDYWALYIQDEFRMSDHFRFNVGLRYDDYDTFGDTTNPRAALIYTPVDTATIKFLYGQAFRAPNAYELYYNDGGESQKGNPDLDAETIDTYEVVYEQYVGEHLNGTIAAFYYETKDLINLKTDSDDLLFFDNLDEVKAKGLEFELEGHWASGLNGRLSYTFQETENETTGKILSNSPKHLGKFNLILPLFREKIFLGIEEQYTGKRKTLSRTILDDFFITNVTLFSGNLVRGLKASLTVYNLFDKNFEHPASEEHEQDVIQQDDQIFRFKLTYQF